MMNPQFLPWMVAAGALLFAAAFFAWRSVLNAREMASLKERLNARDGELARLQESLDRQVSVLRSEKENERQLYENLIREKNKTDAELAATLGGLGFSRVDDPGARAHNARYLADRSDGLRKSGVTRIVTAMV